MTNCEFVISHWSFVILHWLLVIILLAFADFFEAVVFGGIHALENLVGLVALGLRCLGVDIDELVNIYSKAPQTERDEAYKILQGVYPTENDRLEKIRKGQEDNNQ